MRVVGIFIVFDALQLQLSGIIRGIDKQFIGMILGTSIFLIVQTGLCSACLFIYDLNVYSLWVCQIGCAIIGALSYCVVLYKSDWDDLAMALSKNEQLHL